MGEATVVVGLVAVVLAIVAWMQRGRAESAEAESAALNQKLDVVDTARRESDRSRERREREIPRELEQARRDIILELLSVDDHVRRALSASASADPDALRRGIELLAKDLGSIWRRIGLEEVVASPGTPFDPSVHDAIAKVERDDVSEAVVEEVVSAGFSAGEHLVRPARVVVAAPSDGADGED